MDIVAHSLWAAAAAITAKRTTSVKLKVGWAVWWTAFPDVFAFGPMVIVGLFQRLFLSHSPARLHLGLPLYQASHSLIVFALVLVVASLAARRMLYELLGWLLHILIDIPTHSFSYYATRFFWPVSSFRVNGIPWWTPWFWIATYLALAIVYCFLWKKGWLSPPRR